jgi:nucleoside triphosphate pyrophosphatase
MRLVLASASPRRADLLRAAGFEFDVRPANVDERARPGEAPDAYVLRLASEKSRVAHAGGEDALTLGADTAVVVDGLILGKPDGPDDAAQMLRRLSGRTHEVLTGVSLRRGGRELTRVERTLVEFAPLSNEDVAWYVKSREGLDKAGAYAIQGLASRFIRRIDGAYANVVGLPVAAVAELVDALRGEPVHLASPGSRRYSECVSLSRKAL